MLNTPNNIRLLITANGTAQLLAARATHNWQTYATNATLHKFAASRHFATSALPNNTAPTLLSGFRSTAHTLSRHLSSDAVVISSELSSLAHLHHYSQLSRALISFQLLPPSIRTFSSTTSSSSSSPIPSQSPRSSPSSSSSSRSRKSYRAGLALFLFILFMCTWPYYWARYQLGGRIEEKLAQRQTGKKLTNTAMISRGAYLNSGSGDIGVDPDRHKYKEMEGQKAKKRAEMLAAGNTPDSKKL